MEWPVTISGDGLILTTSCVLMNYGVYWAICTILMGLKGQKHRAVPCKKDYEVSREVRSIHITVSSGTQAKISISSVK